MGVEVRPGTVGPRYRPRGLVAGLTPTWSSADEATLAHTNDEAVGELYWATTELIPSLATSEQGMTNLSSFFI